MAPIDPNIVSRYRKLRAKADDPATGPNERDIAQRAAARLVAEHPDLLDAAEEADLRDEAKARATRVPPPKPAAEGAGLFERIRAKAETWAVGTLNEFFEEQEFDRLQRSRARRMHAAQPHPEHPPMAKPSFADQVTEGILIEDVGEVDIDDTIEGVQITFSIPTELWDQLQGRKDGAKVFWEALLLGVSEFEEGGEEEDD